MNFVELCASAMCLTLHPSLPSTLQTGESVEARYTADDVWYAAVVLQVIHGGFEIARCTRRDIYVCIDIARMYAVSGQDRSAILSKLIVFWCFAFLCQM